MGCGCGGSTRAQVVTQPGASVAQAQQNQMPRTGYPGEVGYAWTGPVKAVQPKPAA